ncbi:fungal zn(2)-Cys(6) binuclear cluster domain-containing [Fusarium acutatum]|uniref:Fungal zn(2)-Cys(6) binuclear cluster domain-containing n=1 Tax=Fusarium acutatum TaxID=78861 RepID=A0A8H4NJF8_9HYPO|nr:fungal zn(2)-Cys(6) binuclear cluster domain-containing [Fusarium acutatum]
MESLDDLLAIPAVPESRDLQCEYGTDSDTEHNFGSVKGRRQMKQKERSGSRSGGIMTPFTDGSHSTEDDSGNIQSSNMSEAVVQEPDGMHPELHHMEPDWSEFMFGSPQDISSTPTDTRDFSHDTTFDSTVSMDQVLNSPGSFLTSPPLESMLDDDLYPHDSFPFPQSMISTSETWPARTEQLQDHGPSDDRISSCQCSITPMETWEALTINISSKHPTSQKSIQAQKSAISRLQDRDLQADSEQADHRRSVYEMADDQNGDDDSRVRRNLWTSRMRRLGRLIAKVSELLDGDQWSAQRRLLQDVQLRFTGVMFGWH